MKKSMSSRRVKKAADQLIARLLDRALSQGILQGMAMNEFEGDDYQRVIQSIEAFSQKENERLGLPF